ncbi:hypothetical protein BDZ91DRAFT_723278 [Kalaharituber pfeilii]|nr:hypothetical protein BDZ91DRAFT_723278 [Kalaharituber pfeilii]
MVLCSIESEDAIKKKVNSFIIEQKAELTAQESLSGIAIPASTDLDQAINTWIEVVEYRTEVKQRKLGDKAQMKLEEEIASIRRDNMLKTLLQKHTYQKVVRQVMDLIESSQAISSPTAKRNKRRRIGQESAKTKAFFDSVQSMMKETLDLFHASITSISNTSILPPNPLAPFPPSLAPFLPSPAPLPRSSAPLPRSSAPLPNPSVPVPNPPASSEARLASLELEK